MRPFLSLFAPELLACRFSWLNAASLCATFVVHDAYLICKFLRHASFSIFQRIAELT
jgi:hypothetical protein